MTSASFQHLANFIWSVADLLRGPYRPPQYERVMLPMTVLRRFDCVLEPSKAKVLAEYKKLEGKDSQLVDRVLNSRAKGGDGKPLGFHNHSQLDFQKLKGDPDNVGRHLTDYINGFSENVRKIFEYFEQACRYLVIDFGTSKSPKSTHQRDSHYCPGRPASVLLRHTFVNSALATQHSLK